MTWTSVRSDVVKEGSSCVYPSYKFSDLEVLYQYTVLRAIKNSEIVLVLCEVCELEAKQASRHPISYFFVLECFFLNAQWL